MPHTPLGIEAQLSVIAVNALIAFAQYFKANDGLQLLEVFLNNFCDVASGVTFLGIFCYNGVGPNRSVM